MPSWKADFNILNSIFWWKRRTFSINKYLLREKACALWLISKGDLADLDASLPYLYLWGYFPLSWWAASFPAVANKCQVLEVTAKSSALHQWASSSAEAAPLQANPSRFITPGDYPRWARISTVGCIQVPEEHFSWQYHLNLTVVVKAAASWCFWPWHLYGDGRSRGILICIPQQAEDSFEKCLVTRMGFA